MISFFHTTLLGIIEGVTEYIPVSSTGHLLITQHLLHIPSSDFVSTFEIVIQSGAICAVAVLYLKTIIKHKDLIWKIAFGFLPTMIAGFVLYPFIKKLFSSNLSTVSIALITGGILILIVEKIVSTKSLSNREIHTLTYKEAITLGSLQIFAFIPGVSRSGATIIGGLWAGYPRRFLVEFSFLLAVPTILAAGALDMLHSYKTLTQGNITTLFAGSLVAGICAYITIKYILSYISQHDFKVFGWYRIVVGCISLLIK